MSEKVKLPKEVAEAIISCKQAGLSNIDIVTFMDKAPQLFRDFNKDILESLMTICNFAKGTIGGGQTLLEALVNGYEIELTPEGKVRSIYAEYDHSRSREVAGVIIRVLDALNIEVKGVNADE